MDNYKKYVSHLEIVSDKSSEGSQFVKGFGGIGGILRYRMDGEMEEFDNDNGFDEDDFI
jgi:peptide chain release factor subunit 1